MYLHNHSLYITDTMIPSKGVCNSQIHQLATSESKPTNDATILYRSADPYTVTQPQQIIMKSTLQHSISSLTHPPAGSLQSKAEYVCTYVCMYVCTYVRRKSLGHDRAYKTDTPFQFGRAITQTRPTSAQNKSLISL